MRARFADKRGGLKGRLEKVCRLDDLVDHPYPGGLLGANKPAREEQLPRARGPNAG
jgi:hypothetical protein